VEFTAVRSADAGAVMVRSQVLDSELGHLTDDGTFVVAVEIQILSLEKKPFWSPKVGSKDDDLLKLMDSDDDVDAYFLVGTHKFPVHRCILQVKAPMLYRRIEDVDKGGQVEIQGVSHALFKALLRFVYGRELPNSDAVRENGRELFETADRFGCKKLKLYVESEIVKDCITTENAASWIVFAHSHSCGYLKEAAVDVFDSDPQAVMKSCGWTELSDSKELLLELMGTLADRRGTKRRSAWEYYEKNERDGYTSDDYDNMSVWGSGNW